MNASEYWDGVANKVGDVEALDFSDNFDKRRLLIREFLEFDFQDQRVLEVGVGCGVTAAILTLLHGGLNYKGTDLSKTFCTLANKIFRLDTRVASIIDLPFEDNSFDVAMLLDVLEHVPPTSRDMGYGELDRVLADKAVVFINNPITESQHDPDFDYGFNDQDIVNMADALGMRVTKLKIIHAKGYYYQFIAMSR